ncbi:hypothetical protein [Burkholderia seminalis]|uniref:hypothetical protein n=1 Tax=Burkholderia seminalis TaxID=488731 RepID=UPI00084F7A88|nr:hypothetical protein [Burkholderia seminalis]
MSDEKDEGPSDGAWGRRHAVLYGAEMSALYHQKRERFFELWDKLTKAFSLLGGSAALFKASDAGTVAVIAVIITAGSALSLVFGFSERARRHAELSREFKSLIADVHDVGQFSFTEKDIDRWSAAKCRIDVKEPPALGVLVQICQNEISIAQGQPDKVVQIGFFKRCLANFVDLSV